MSHGSEDVRSRPPWNHGGHGRGEPAIACALDGHGPPTSEEGVRGAVLEALSGIEEVLGIARFTHVMQSAGKARVQKEWDDIAGRASLEEGITAFFARLTRAGWGRIEILALDLEDQKATFRIHRGWEAAYQKALSVCWETSYTGGALAACCERLFDTPCAIEQVRFAAIEGEYDEIVVRAKRQAPLEEPAPESPGDLTGTIDALQQEIKERARTEAALRVTERRLRGFLDSGLLGFSMTSPKAGWLEVNDKLCEMLGYSRDEIFLKSWPELTHPEDLPADLAIYQRLISGEIDSFTQDKRFIRKDGQIIEVTVSVQGLRRPDCSIEYLVALVQDVTAKKRAERALREHLATIERQQESIRALSSPIIQVWEGVLALPVVGALDQERSMTIMDRLLSQIVARRARHAILDLTGVDTIDAETADRLLRIIGAIRLLGARAVVSGISAQVAQTMIQCGVDLSGVVARSSLHEALRLCLAKPG